MSSEIVVYITLPNAAFSVHVRKACDFRTVTAEEAIDFAKNFERSDVEDFARDRATGVEVRREFFSGSRHDEGRVDHGDELLFAKAF